MLYIGYFIIVNGQNIKKNRIFQITSQRLLDQSQAGVCRGKHHIPPHFGPIHVPYV